MKNLQGLGQQWLRNISHIIEGLVQTDNCYGQIINDLWFNLGHKNINAAKDILNYKLALDMQNDLTEL